ncbi:MAG: NAD(P)-dependent oxidoreductase [Actinobacteria bacterium]|nr:NAD(P)-dependent oxidoreductase [Actinomycetota bacterium]
MSDTAPANRHVLVVGGGGYVGSVLVRALLTSGYRVRVLDRFIYGHADSLSSVIDEPAFSLVRGDLRDVGASSAAFEDITDVVLLASMVGDPISKQYPDLTRSINVDGSERFLQAASDAGVERVVFTSTCSNYGLRDTDTPAVETDALNPKSLYAETKVALERWLVEEQDELAFEPVILRIATAYGGSPRMRFDLTVNEFVRELALGRNLLVYDKDTWRPYCHTHDIARAILLALQASSTDVAGEVFNVGGGDSNWTKATIVQEILRHLDGEVEYGEHGSDPRNYRVSFDKIERVLGFTTQRSVADFVPRLVAAVEAGLFHEVEDRGNYHGNWSVGQDVTA